jgi:hypothetical protein
MRSKNINQSFVLCLLAISQSIGCPSFAIDDVSNGIRKAHSDKSRSVVLSPKWSLPFQGQLGSAQQGNAAAPKNKPGDDLAIFKPKKVQVLSITPPETMSNNILAEASLPGFSTAGDTTKQNGKFIAGEVSVWDGPFDSDRIVNHLLDTHFANSPAGHKFDEQVKRQSNLTHKSIAVTKDSFQELFGYQGVEPSMRAGQLILDSPKMKIRNVAWADYVRQRYIDKIHAQIVSALMQLAEGIGNSETENGTNSIATATGELNALVGNEESERAVKSLTVWLNNAKVSYATFAQSPWTTGEREKKLEEVLITAVDNDPVITGVTKRVMKYANPSRLKRRSSQVIQTTLNGLTIFAPGVIPSVGAGALLLSYKASTGGTEENKLERELLLDKRIQSRLKVITQEASLALDNYRYALVTKNPPLLVFSQEVLENLTGKSGQLNLLSNNKISNNSAPAQDYDNTNTIVPALKDNTDDMQKKQSKIKFVVKNVRQMAVCSNK